MNTLREALQEYVTLRRSFGFKFRDDARVLARFVTFMEERRALHITVRLTLEWLRQMQTVQPAERARRLCFVRGFARHRSATDPFTEVPSQELCPIEPSAAVSLHRAGSAGLAGGGATPANRMAVNSVAALGLSLPIWSAQRHGPAHL